jgi:hypothetical protein
MIEAMKQALEFFESGNFVYPTKIATDLRQAIAELESQEPVAWRLESGQAVWFERTDPEANSALPNDVTAIPLYTQPQRTWVGLTDEERYAIEAATLDLHGVPKFFATAIEAKLKEKNT